MLFGFGGLTFPIMAFLLVEGYRHTSNVARYARRLLVFALVAQVPFGMFLSPGLNVLFTLLVCLGLLAPCMVMVLRVVSDQRRRIAYSALLPIAANGLPALEQLLAMPSLQNLAFALYPLVGCTATIPLLWAYNGGRGRPMKWFFYAYYPAHIAVLGLAKGLLLGDWSIASV